MHPMEAALTYPIAGIVGFALSAACGMRIFAPLALLSIAVRTGWLTPGESLLWIGTLPAVICFTAACVVEILGMLIPWVDHILDIAGTPVAAVAGTLVMATQLAAASGIDTTAVPPWVTWSLAAVVGGGVATGVHIAAGTIRAGSTAVSGGVLNPIFSIVETVSSVVLALLAFAAPILAGLIAVIVLASIVAIMIAVMTWSKRAVAARDRKAPSAAQ